MKREEINKIQELAQAVIKLSVDLEAIKLQANALSREAKVER